MVGLISADLTMAMGPSTTALVSRTKKSIIEGPCLMLNQVCSGNKTELKLYHSDRNNRHVHSFVLASDRGEASVRRNGLDGERFVQESRNDLSSGNCSHSDDTIGNITITNLNKHIVRRTVTRSKSQISHPCECSCHCREAFHWYFHRLAFPELLRRADSF